jgi:TonB family protein
MYMNILTPLLKFRIITLSCVVLFALNLSGSATSLGQRDDQWNTKILEQIEELKGKIARDPNDAHSHYQLGHRYVSVYRVEEGIAAFEQAVRVKPDFAVAHYHLGWTYGSAKRYTEALGAFEQAVAFAHVKSFKLELTKAQAQHAIGWTYYALARYDEAIAAYRHALEFNPKFEDSLYEIGRVNLAQGNREEALQIAGKLTYPLNDWLSKEVSLTAAPAAGETENQRVILAPSPTNRDQSEPVSRTLKPTIHYKEKAKYTESARQNRIQGIVVLSVVFHADGRMGSMRVIRGLPYGLTAHALIAAEKIRFQPAQKDGRDVSVRGNLEFSFNLY